MRNLYTTLLMFQTESPMEYCEEIHCVKSILEYCNQNVKPFNRVCYRSGNESFINELSRRLQGMFMERNLVETVDFTPLPKAYHVLRKVLMYLMCNTDSTYMYNLHSDPVVSHVFETCPLMPRFVLVALVWELQLDSLFFEALSYTPCWFAFQFFESASISLKHVGSPYEVLIKVEKLVRAICINLKRSYLRKMEPVDRQIIHDKLYDSTINILRLFYTPDAEKFNHFTKDQLHRYSGYTIKQILQMVLFAFDVYETPHLVDPTIDIGIYEIGLHQCKQVSAQEAERESNLLKKQQLKIITALLNALQYNVMLVKIDVFMSWVEVKVSPNENMQLIVGEMAYKVGERILANPDFAHDLVAQLKMIAIRPKTLEETTRDATLGEILRKLDDNLPRHTKKVWFDELLQRSVALGNDECVNSIKQNIKLMTVENCQHIMDYLKLEIESNQEAKQIIYDGEEPDAHEINSYSSNCGELTALVLMALNNFNKEQLLQLLAYQLKLFSSTLGVWGMCVFFEQRATQFFNKFATCINFDMQKFLMLCFENAQEMWDKFFDNACYNQDYIKNFCATVKETAPYSNSYFDSLFSRAMCNPVKIQQKFFPELLCEIYIVLYYPTRSAEFFNDVVNENVNAYLESLHFKPVLPIVKALNLISVHGETQSNKPLNFCKMTAPVLVMVANILDTSRWDMACYTNMRDMVVRECIQFIQHNSKKFLPLATTKDREWISKSVKDLYRPLTWYYFQKFALTPDQSPTDFDRFLMPHDYPDKEMEMLLISHYVRCTRKETEWLARSERMLPHISNAVVILGNVAENMNSSHAINNYRHCLANYANIVTKIMLPKFEANPRKLEQLILKMLQIIGAAPAQTYDEIFMNFEWLLFEILKKCTQPLNEEFSTILVNVTSSMVDCQAKEIFLNKFQTLTA